MCVGGGGGGGNGAISKKRISFEAEKWRVRRFFRTYLECWNWCATRWGGRVGPPLPFLKIEKKCPDFGKKCPHYVLPWVKFSIQNVVSSSAGPSFSFVFDEIFIKVPKYHETSSALKNFWLRACLMGENRGAAGGRGSIVKCREAPFGGSKACDRVPWDLPCMAVLWKLFNTFG